MKPSLKQSISNLKCSARRPVVTLLVMAVAALALGCEVLVTPSAGQPTDPAGPTSEATLPPGAATNEDGANPASGERVGDNRSAVNGDSDDGSDDSSSGLSSDGDSDDASSGDANFDDASSDDADSGQGSRTVSRPAPNSGTSDVQRTVPSPTPEYVQAGDVLPRNTVGLILAVRGGSSTSTLKTVVQDPGSGQNTGVASITLEKDSKSVIMYLPDTGESTVIDSYVSASYAPQFKRPYTVNDRLFVSNKFTGGGALSLTEYDPTDLSPGLRWGTQLDAVDPGYVVAGGQVFFKTDTEDRWTLSGTVRTGGDLISSPLSDQWQSTQLDQPARKFKLVSSGDALFGAYLPNSEDPVSGVFTVDPATGEIAERYSAAFEVEGLEDYHGSSFRHVVIEDGTAYWVAYRTGPNGFIVDVISVDLTDPDLAIRESSFDIPPSNGTVSGFYSTFDVDGGYVLIKPLFTGGDYSKVVIYDTVNANAQLIDTGFHISDAEILYLE